MERKHSRGPKCRCLEVGPARCSEYEMPRRNNLLAADAAVAAPGNARPAAAGYQTRRVATLLNDISVVLLAARPPPLDGRFLRATRDAQTILSTRLLLAYIASLYTLVKRFNAGSQWRQYVQEGNAGLWKSPSPAYPATSTNGRERARSAFSSRHVNRSCARSTRMCRCSGSITMTSATQVSWQQCAGRGSAVTGN